ncbi:hypothetical protein M670_02872 [Schinkia azotoformans MEV2011]|uniref:Phage ABA sandwich domain-containing protein n=2 Tax=Schinkia azotoformans TaxID=1454 RepID=K6D5Y8_SCHAZ|nr:hypothetical protein [Schinkia azotoformans]EKN67937.1 hypothetical protein BAZO_06979 [Schinkia azotoformans LMG 9581]KEF37841.1 hypothetical protein M670_02872 [Schinkia azotoformans MEV2011]MEC1637043.1 hypothetical protein [Schinkia azotoformans]MEC1696523.1 hypothetical protein [Schinkia azotoformans]MEC1716098.1 hypothetical protein [Schinkia azotoformans]
MNKIDAIARRIFGWKLNRWDRWYDHESRTFIHDSEFQPEKNLDHAMLIVDKLQKFGFTYKTNGTSEVSFNDATGTGETLAQAITNAAYSIIEKNSSADSSRMWSTLC